MARRRKRSIGAQLTKLFCWLAVPVAAGALVYALVDPSSFKPRIAAVVRAATGRDLQIDGPITLHFSLHPSLQAEGLRLSNPAEFSRPDIAALQQARATLALWPLLRGHIEISQLTLSGLDLRLETNAQRQSNWHFAKQPAAPEAAAAAPQAESFWPSWKIFTARMPQFNVGLVQLGDSKLEWRDANGAVKTVDIHNLTAIAEPVTGTISTNAAFSLDRHEVALTAESGTFERLFEAAESAPAWPLQVVARVEGARLAASGSIAHPLDHRGYQFALDATAPDMGLLSTALGHALPGLHDVSVSAKISDASGAMTASDLLLRAGVSDLGESVPHLRLEQLELSAAGLDHPVHADISAALDKTAVHVTGELGPVAGLRAEAMDTPYAVDLIVQSLGATMSVKGEIADPKALSGVNLTISAAVPNLAGLRDLVGQTLPELNGVSLDARVTEGEGGVRQTWMLHDLQLRGPNGAFSGDVTVNLRPRRALRGVLSGEQINVDGFLAVWRQSMPPLASLMPEPTPTSTPEPEPAPMAGSAAVVGVASAAVPLPVRAHPIFSERVFDLRGWGDVDSDLQLSIADVQFSGTHYQNLSAHFLLDHGKLAVDPLVATSPVGALDVRFGVDSTLAPPQFTLGLSAPGLALRPWLAFWGVPDAVSGATELEADVTARGVSAHALAASLSGRLGVAMGEGEIENQALSATAGMVFRGAKLPADVLLGGKMVTGAAKIHCFVARMDVASGVASVNALVLDTKQALLQGGGVLNLEDETMALRLRPMLRTGGPGIVVPVLLTGPFEAPVVTSEGGLANGLLGALNGLMKKSVGVPVNFQAGERGGDACGPALAAARGARPAAKP